MNDIYTPKYQLADPRVSPDGKNVAFIEGLMSDEGSTGGDIFVVPTYISSGSRAKPHARNPDLSPRDRIGSIPRPHLIFSSNVNGNSAFATL